MLYGCISIFNIMLAAGFIAFYSTVIDSRFMAFGPNPNASSATITIDSWYVWAAYIVIIATIYILVLALEAPSRKQDISETIGYIFVRATNVFCAFTIAPQADLAAITIVIGEISIYHLILHWKRVRANEPTLKMSDDEYITTENVEVDLRTSIA